MRRIQRIAYRMRQLQETRRDFGTQSKQAWQHAPHWQPLRAMLEQLLVTFEGGAAFVGLNLVLKPMFDRLFTLEFAHLAEQNGDPLLGRILAALGDDCRWHRQWTRALVRASVEGQPELAEDIEGELSRWHVAARRALGQLEPLWASEARAWSVVQRELWADTLAFWESTGLRTAGVA